MNQEETRRFVEKREAAIEQGRQDRKRFVRLICSAQATLLVLTLGLSWVLFNQQPFGPDMTKVCIGVVMLVGIAAMYALLFGLIQVWDRFMPTPPCPLHA